MGTSTVRAAWSANWRVLGVRLEVVGIRRHEVCPHRHLARPFEQHAVVVLARRELEELPGRPAVHATGVHPDRLLVAERGYVLGVLAVLRGNRHGAPVDLVAVDGDRPRPDDRHRGLLIAEGIALVGFLGDESLVVQTLPELGHREPVGRVELRFAVVDQALPRLSDQEGVVVEPGLIELRRRAGPDRGLHAALLDERLRRLREVCVRLQRRIVGGDASLAEDRLVVEDHHRVRLPGHLVELAVGELVLVGAITGPGGDVGGAIRELVEGDETARLLELRHGGGGGVEDEARRVASRDRRTDHFLGAGARRDLLPGDLFVRVVLVPGIHAPPCPR